MSSTSPPPADQTTRRAALVVATLTSFLGPFMASSVNVALPAMGQQIGMSAVLLGWVNMAFLLTATPLSIPFGRLGDIHGRKKLYMAGVAAFALSSGIIALAGSSATVLIGRALQGVGASMIFATGMAILVSVYPSQQRGRVLGINVAAVYVGLSAGPFLGGLITEHLGWRAIFWFNLPVGALLLTVIAVMLRGEWAEAGDARFDLPGAALLVLALGLTMYGFASLPGLRPALLLGGGLLGLVAFVIVEARTASPLFDLGLFRNNRVFAFSSLAALVNYAATAAVSFLLSLYLQEVRGLSPQETGLVLVSQPLVQALLSPLAGRLSDRVEPRTVASAGMALCFVGLGLLNFIGAHSPLTHVLAALVFLGFGFAFFSSPNTKAIMNAVQRREFGVASALVGTMRQLGMTLSMGTVMLILTLKLGQASVEPQNAAGFISAMRAALTIFAALCFGGIFASLARGRSNHR